MKRHSIKKQLITLFVPLILSFWLVSALVSFWLVSKFSAEAFDRDLINSADSVVGRLRFKENHIVVDLPAAAQAILRRDQSDKIFYRAISNDGDWIAGDKELPAPASDLIVDIPRLSNATVKGKEVRLVEIKASIDEAPGQSAIVQVAETTNVRKNFQEVMVLSVVAPQLCMFLFSALAVWYGIARILKPLTQLQQEVTNRSQADLSHLSDDFAPEEVYPLVSALNRLLDRLKQELSIHQRFIANATHQLRTPLAGLKTYSSIGTEMNDPDDLKLVVKQLDHGIDRASRLVSQLLALARSDGSDSGATGKTNIDLNFVVSDVVADLAPCAIRLEQELSYEPSAQSATLFGEPTGLRNLVSNLIENSMLYSGKGGTIKATVRTEGNILLSISDSGKGIPEDEREKVFERFYRVTGTAGEGTGLGLAIVKEVAKAHGARVWITDGADQSGTVVNVEFPKAS